MGQILYRQLLFTEANEDSPHAVLPKKFPDLHKLPPELALLVLSNLNATDLYLASCVWKDLADIEILWHGLCRSQWTYATVYNRFGEKGFSFKALYLKLDEAILTFNADAELGYEYIIKHELVADTPTEWARFIHGARNVDCTQRREFLEKRPQILDEIVKLQNFENQFLPNALRQFFDVTTPPNQRNNYLSELVGKFSQRFCSCNPKLGLSEDTVYVICFSLIMLSVDLSSPHIKNKMSKREFIRNTRGATNGINDDFAGDLYDNIYLIGHVAPRAL